MTAIGLEMPRTAMPLADEIPKRIKISWATGAMGVSILMNGIGGLILFYMVSVLHIAPALAGSLVFVSKLCGIFTDPLIGGWSDRLQISSSRRRPFLLTGAVVCALSFLVIFSTPMFASEALRSAYVFVGLLAYTAGYAAFNVPFMSMPAEMTDSYHERSSIHGYRMMFVSTGGLVTGSLVPLLLEHMGRTQWNSYAVVGLGGAAIIFATMVVAWAGTRDARFTTAQTERPALLKEIGHVFANRHFVRLLLVKACQLVGIAATQAAGLFFLLNVLQRGLEILAYASLLVVGVSLVASPLLVRLSRVIGKSQTYIVAGTLYVLVVISWIFASPAEPAWAYLLRMAVISVGACGNIIMAMSMLTDIIHQDTLRTGIRREGVFTAFYSFTEKFTFAFGPLIVGIALSAAGFDQKLPPETMRTPEIRQALLLGVSYIPAVTGIIAILLLAGYKLREEDLKA
jgi:GPH family glycoside/pentoside/hexuronide:cation symporter